MLAADQLGDGVDLVGGERDDRGASRLARDLAVAGELQRRQPRPRHDGRARQQFFDDGPHGGRAQQQRLVAPAAIEHAVGEDMTALEIRGNLDFVDGQERHVEIARHGFHGGNPEARRLRLDLLLAGDQRDALAARTIGDLVVDLAREQPQRQADQAARMRQHALDRQMRLAGVGGPQHGGNAGAGRPFITERGVGRREGHSWDYLCIGALIARPLRHCLSRRSSKSEGGRDGNDGRQGRNSLIPWDS
ncbi:hypothetical protein ES707_09824 [subsurface metagenome]